ncbi:YcxB family protein [Agrobacterium sp. Ap1]|uniref:YcxB family protein n=1 Tax=Agrobacterium sp. Ap1 TaxID=2815337 RepID=UPI000F9999B3|nr:YcxB family protein [Agrobacterium sp. Ap1]MBO0140512.1 YcxB family protein [Agrobacterium sp. Ap1]
MGLVGSHRFTVRYDDDIVRDAIRAFVWRRAVVEQKMMWVISVLMLSFSIYFIISGDNNIFAGVMLVLALAPVIFVAVIWRAHKVNTFGRYKRMGDPKAEITVDADGIDIVSDLGSGKLTWRSITEVWERPRAFMVFSGDGQFNTLPRETMPDAVQAYLRTRPTQG